MLNRHDYVNIHTLIKTIKFEVLNKLILSTIATTAKVRRKLNRKLRKIS